MPNQYVDPFGNVVEAQRLEAEIFPPEDGALDPNTRSHAEIAGWLLGHGERGFRVAGDRQPFALELLSYTEGLGRQIQRVEPGDWVLRYVDHFVRLGDQEFRSMFHPLKEDA